MADLHKAREQAGAFAATHVARLSREVNEWKNTGQLSSGLLTELAGLVSPFAGVSSLATAECFVNRAARDLAAAQLESGMSGRLVPGGVEGLHAEVEVAVYTLPASSRGTDPLRIERVSRRDGPARWAVRWMGNVLAKDGSFEDEPSPSSRDDDFLARCRFETAEEAVAAAQAAIAAGACEV